MDNRRELSLRSAQARSPRRSPLFAQQPSKIGRIGFPYAPAVRQRCGNLRYSSSSSAISAMWKVRPSPSIICRGKEDPVGCRPLPPNWSGATWTSSWPVAEPSGYPRQERDEDDSGCLHGCRRSGGWASWPASHGPAAMSRASPASNWKRQSRHLHSSGDRAVRQARRHPVEPDEFIAYPRCSTKCRLQRGRCAWRLPSSMRRRPLSLKERSHEIDTKSTCGRGHPRRFPVQQ